MDPLFSPTVRVSIWKSKLSWEVHHLFVLQNSTSLRIQFYPTNLVLLAFPCQVESPVAVSAKSVSWVGLSSGLDQTEGMKSGSALVLASMYVPRRTRGFPSQDAGSESAGAAWISQRLVRRAIHVVAPFTCWSILTNSTCGEGWSRLQPV